MPILPSAFGAYLHEAIETRGRSTALQDLRWLLGLMIVLTLGLFEVKAAIWFTSIAGVICVAVIGLFIYAYIYMMRTNPDLLRTENYAISKLMIQNNRLGDSLTGEFTEPTVLTARAAPALTASTDAEETEETEQTEEIKGA